MNNDTMVGWPSSLHDAVVDSFSFDASRCRLEVIIWQKLESGNMSWGKLVVSGIAGGSAQKLQEIQATIDAVLRKEKRKSLSFRIDEFQCRKQPVVNGGSGFTINLSIDHLASMTIDCLKCTFLPLQ